MVAGQLWLYKVRLRINKHTKRTFNKLNRWRVRKKPGAHLVREETELNKYSSTWWQNLFYLSASEMECTRGKRAGLLLWRTEIKPVGKQPMQHDGTLHVTFSTRPHQPPCGLVAFLFHIVPFLFAVDDISSESSGLNIWNANERRKNNLLNVPTRTNVIYKHVTLRLETIALLIIIPGLRITRQTPTSQHKQPLRRQNLYQTCKAYETYKTSFSLEL